MKFPEASFDSPQFNGAQMELFKIRAKRWHQHKAFYFYGSTCESAINHFKRMRKDWTFVSATAAHRKHNYE